MGDRKLVVIAEKVAILPFQEPWLRQARSWIPPKNAVFQGKLIELTVPDHKPIQKSTLARLIKESGLSLEEFQKLL